MTDKEHIKRVKGYVKAIRSLGTEFSERVANMVLFQIGDINLDIPFAFDDYPEIQQSVEAFKEYMYNKLSGVLTNGITTEWQEANIACDALVASMCQDRTIPQALITNWYRHTTASSFIVSSRNGMRLSDRVWKLTELYQKGIQQGVAAALKSGMSAKELADDVAKYLRKPQILARDYEDRYGLPVAVDNAQGQAFRLARTEINRAYKQAEQERWQTMDFVVGYEVKLSYQHPRYDICDELQGKYPKDFKFGPWHPNCFCMALPITMSDTDFEAYLNEQEVEPKNEVTDAPGCFKHWVQSNEAWLETHKKPFFIQDNKRYVKEALKKR